MSAHKEMFSARLKEQGMLWVARSNTMSDGINIKGDARRGDLKQTWRRLLNNFFYLLQEQVIINRCAMVRTLFQDIHTLFFTCRSWINPNTLLLLPPMSKPELSLSENQVQKQRCVYSSSLHVQRNVTH